MKKILQMQNITKNFGRFAALKGINIEVSEGEAVAIIGSSGSGKSTLLRCVNNLEKISGGTIEIDGEKIAENGRYKSEKEVRRICGKTAMVFQNFNLFPHLTCLENIMITPQKILKQEKAAVEKRARDLLETVGLAYKADAYPEKLSGGQKQRVAIARALAINPTLMLFDEPTSALDPEITNEVVSVIADLAKRKMTMLIVTHDMRFAREAASRVIYLDEGEILEQGTPAEIFDSPKSERLKTFLSALY